MTEMNSGKEVTEDEYFERAFIILACILCVFVVGAIIFTPQATTSYASMLQ